MEPLAKDAPEPAVAEGWQNNVLALYRLFGKSPAVEYVETPLFARWHTRLAYPPFEGVQVFQPPPEEADAFIEEQVGYFRGLGVTAFTWWIKPPLANAAWHAAMLAQGFAFEPGERHMAMALEELPESVRWADGLEIRVVEDTAALRVWMDTFKRGYPLPPEWWEPFESVYLPLGCDLPLRHYIAYLNGEPAAASTVFLAEGVAGIWNVATLPEARGQGIGGAVTWQPLRDARQMGYAIAALDSSELGFPVYSRLGFHAIICPGNYIKTV